MPLNTFSNKAPFKGKIKSVKRIVGPNATGETCDIVIETNGDIPFWEGQSYGVIPPVSGEMGWLSLDGQLIGCWWLVAGELNRLRGAAFGVGGSGAWRRNRQRRAAGSVEQRAATRTTRRRRASRRSISQGCRAPNQPRRAASSPPPFFPSPLGFCQTPQGTKVNSKGKEVPHGVRLYSIASSRYGDSYDGKTTTLCVRRAVFVDPETGEWFDWLMGIGSGWAKGLEGLGWGWVGRRLWSQRK